MIPKEAGLDSDDQIALYCGRLTCGKVVVQSIGRGRRREFCSETCRRAADRDYKRARAHVDLFEEQLRKSQHEVAAYGRKSEEDMLTSEDLRRLQTEARVAFARAATVVELGSSPERAMAELETLVAAVRPLLGQSDAWVSSRSA